MPEEEILSLPQGSAKNLIKKGEMTILSLAAPSKEPSPGSHMYERARELLGQDFLGIEAVQTMEDKLKQIGINVKFDLENIPTPDWNEEDLKWAKEKGEALVLEVSTMIKDGKKSAVGLIDFRELFRQGDPLGQIPTLFYSFRPDASDWYKQEDFAVVGGKIGLGWRFVKKEVLEGSTSKNYSDQSRVIKQYEKELSKSGAARKSQRRRTATEVAYDSLLYYINTGERLLPNTVDWTEDQSSDGLRVCVGLFDALGLDVDYWPPGNSSPDLGVCPSR